MNQGIRERKIIAALERGRAVVRPEDGGLDVGSTRTDELVELAAQLPQMRRFNASWCGGEPELKGPELRHLRGHEGLRDVDIHGMPVSGEHFEVFATLPNLEILRCSPNANTKDALRYIGKCGRLRILTLNYSEICDADLESLSGLQQVEEIDFLGDRVSSGVRVVRHLRKLKDLGLEDTQVNDEALQAISSLPLLERLFIGSPNVTDAGAENLTKCLTLRTLSIASAGVTCRGLERLAALTNLESLYISQTVPDAGLLGALASLPRLAALHCSAKGLTDEEQISLSARLPRCDIDWQQPRPEFPTADATPAGPVKEELGKKVPFARLLAEATDFDLCGSTFLKIGDRHGQNWIDVTKYLPEERVVMLVWHSAGIIDNGGFEYLFSSDFEGDPDFHLTADAYKTAGLAEAYAAFQAAFKMFPDGRVPNESARRVELYKAQPGGARNVINRKFWKEGWAKNTEKKLAAYIRKNAAAFKNLK